MDCFDRDGDSHRQVNQQEGYCFDQRWRLFCFFYCLNFWMPMRMKENPMNGPGNKRSMDKRSWSGNSLEITDSCGFFGLTRHVISFPFG